MITIEFGPVHSHVDGSTKAERKEAFNLLGEALSLYVDGYFFAPTYMDGTWDGKKQFFTPNGRFPSGLLTKVLQILGDEFSVQVNGYPEPHVVSDTLQSVELFDKANGSISLYDYQVEAIRKALRYNRGILRVATNGGKTEILAAILKLIGCPSSLFLIPRKELLDQTVDRLEERLQRKVGKVGDGVYKPIYNGPTVAMFQTLHRRIKEDASQKKWVNGTSAVFADECHFLRDARYQWVMNQSRANLRLGVSGTPFPKKNDVDRYTVIGQCGPVLATVSNAELIDKGISVKPNIMFLEPLVSMKEKMMLQWNSHDFALQNCEARHLLIAELARGLVESGRQTVIMLKKVEHGKQLLEYLPEAEFAHGNSGNRKEIKHRLASGEVFSLICTAIFDTGLSVDYIEGLIMAGGGTSDINLLQSLGRGLRRAKDKVKDLWVIDFWDTFNKYTVKHSRARYREFQAQEAFNFVESLSEAPAELHRAGKYVAPYKGRR